MINIMAQQMCIHPEIQVSMMPTTTNPPLPLHLSYTPLPCHAFCPSPPNGMEFP